MSPIEKFGTMASKNEEDRKSTRLNSSHSQISYAVFCLKKKITVHLEPTIARVYIVHCSGTDIRRIECLHVCATRPATLSNAVWLSTCTSQPDAECLARF